MTGRSRRKKCLLLLLIGVTILIFPSMFSSEQRETILKLQIMRDGFQRVPSFHVSPPDTTRAVFKLYVTHPGATTAVPKTNVSLPETNTAMSNPKMVFPEKIWALPNPKMSPPESIRAVFNPNMPSAELFSALSNLKLSLPETIRALSYLKMTFEESNRAAPNPTVSLPETIRINVTKTFMVNTTGTPGNTDYWERKLYNFYDVPDPFSSLIGPQNVTFKSKYMIYRCDTDAMQHCGGWADRVKSMITVYLLANLTGRVFKAENIMPECDIHRFIMPNHIDWTLPVSFHENVTASNQTAIIDMYSKPDAYRNFSKTDWIHHPALAADFVYMKSNHDNADNFREYKLHPESLKWMHNLTRVSVNRVLFKHLFIPSHYLRDKLIHFLAYNVKSDEKLICAHLRMGRNPTMPEDFRYSIRERHLVKIWKLIKKLMMVYKYKFKIFLMSDSEKAIAYAQKQDFKEKVFIAPGKIVHVELSSNATAKEKCDGFEKVIFEQQVLPHCDSLVITDSGLSRMAAYLRGRDDGLYCLIPRGRLVRCKPIDLKTKVFRTVN